MGTKNKAVTVYLPADIEACLSTFCLKNGLSRQRKKSGKEKPALGTGIIEILRIFFSSTFDNGEVPATSAQDQSQTIVSDSLAGTIPTQDWVAEEIQQAIAQLKMELLGTDNTSPQTPPEQQTEANSPQKVSSLDVLNQAALARRLRSNPSTLSRHNNKGSEHFAEWTRAKDPDGRAWQYKGVEDNKKVFETIAP